MGEDKQTDLWAKWLYQQIRLHGTCTQEELSAMCKTNQKTVNQWLSGKKIPNLRSVEKVCRLLKADFIVRWKDD